MSIRKPFTDSMFGTELLCNNCPFPMEENTISGTWIWYSVEDRLLFSEDLAESISIPKETYHTFQTFFDILHGNDLLAFLRHTEEILQGGSSRWISFHVHSTDNTIVKLRCYIEAVSSEFGEVVDVVGICFKIEE